MTFDTAVRLRAPPFALRQELWDAVSEHGYRAAREEADGWLFARSASAPGEVAVAAAGFAGPFFLSVEHGGVAAELLGGERAAPCARGHSGAFAFPSRDALFAAVSAAYRLSVSLPTLPLDEFNRAAEAIGATEAEALARRRIGQDVFRKALLAYWNGRCPMTGIDDPDLLRASHIVPWADCATDAERLDVHNGLLLSALWDAAFDKGLVTFGEEGRAQASPRLGAQAREALRVEDAPPLVLSSEARVRMAWHRQTLFQNEHKDA